ncbi:MAG: hypothetical protein QXT91_00765 [Candidatus Caldarchaeum sp.]
MSGLFSEESPSPSPRMSDLAILAKPLFFLIATGTVALLDGNFELTQLLPTSIAIGMLQAFVAFSTDPDLGKGLLPLPKESLMPSYWPATALIVSQSRPGSEVFLLSSENNRGSSTRKSISFLTKTKLEKL